MNNMKSIIDQIVALKDGQVHLLVDPVVHAKLIRAFLKENKGSLLCGLIIGKEENGVVIGHFF